MLDVPPGHAPDCLRTWVRGKANWNDFARAKDGCHASVRVALIKAQGDRCAYCLRGIAGEGDAHIEHFRPRSARPNLLFVWENLLASCESRKHCGKAKDNDARELVDPRRHRPSRIFTLQPITGRIALRSDVCAECTERGFASIEVLKLNCDALVNERRSAAEGFLCLLGSEEFAGPDCLGDQDVVALIEDVYPDYPFLPLLLDAWRVPAPRGTTCPGCSP